MLRILGLLLTSLTLLVVADLEAPHLRPRSPASTEKLLLVDYSDPGEKLTPDQPERVGSGR